MVHEADLDLVAVLAPDPKAVASKPAALTNAGSKSQAASSRR
jgi:hypothetical protein